MTIFNGTATFAGAGVFAANAGLTYLVQSYAPGSERNDFTGQVGMLFTPTADLLVSQMGLRCGTGATGNHTVSLYMWNGGAPIGPLLRTATVSLTGGTIGNYYYTAVSPITLSQDVQYVLVTTVTASDGQFWGIESTTNLNDAVNLYPVFSSDGVTFTATNYGNQFAGVDLGFKATNFTHLVSSYGAHSERNDFTGQVGVVFTPTVDLTFNRIGRRMATSDTGSHTLNLYDWGNGGNPIGSLLVTATVDLTGGMVGQFYYSAITPITLSQGSTYALVAPVTNGDGQSWGGEDITTLFSAANQSSTFTTDSVTFTVRSPAQQYMGVDLNFIGILAQFSGNGRFAANASVIDATAAAFPGTSTFTSNATVRFADQTVFVGAGSFTAGARAQFAAQATFAGGGGFAATSLVGYAVQSTLSGVGRLTANAVATSIAHFNGTGRFTANASVRLAAQGAFSGTGRFTAAVIARLPAVAALQGTGTVSASPFIHGLSGFATLRGNGKFVARPAILRKAIVTLAASNGRWSQVFDSNGSFYPPLGAPPLVPAPGENGFTLYFISGAATHPLPSGTTMMLTGPDGTLIPIGQPAYYTGYDNIFDFNRGAGAFAAYVTHGSDITQVGIWQMQLKNASNHNLSGIGYFNVAA